MKRGKKKAWFYSMPFLIIVGLMIVVPLLYTVEISFTNMSIYHWKDYHCVGLDNYKKALLAFDSGTSLLFSILTESCIHQRTASGSDLGL